MIVSPKYQKDREDERLLFFCFYVLLLSTFLSSVRDTFFFFRVLQRVPPSLYWTFPYVILLPYQVSPHICLWYDLSVYTYSFFRENPIM